MRTVLLPALFIVLLALTPWKRPVVITEGELIDLNVKKATLAETLRLLEAKTGQKIVASDDLEARITLSIRQQPLHDILDQIASQIGAVSMVVLPIYSAESSLAELKDFFQTGSTGARWGGATRTFFDANRKIYSYDPADSNFFVNLDASAFPAANLGPIITEISGAHLLFEDGEQQKVSICLYDEPAEMAVQKVARRLGKQWTRLHVLHPRPAEFVKLRAAKGRQLAAFSEEASEALMN